MGTYRMGPEVTLSNRLIRKMFRLANASREDVFYDLGCGKGQLCVIAVTEFGVKRAVGIELHKTRAKKAKRYMRSLGFNDRIEIRHEDYHDSDLSKATIAYNGLMEDEDELEFYEIKLSRGCRLVTLNLPLVGAMPDAQDYPFYLMNRPFRRTKNVGEWVEAVLSKRRATLDDLISELKNDRDYITDIRGLKSLMRGRIRT